MQQYSAPAHRASKKLTPNRISQDLCSPNCPDLSQLTITNGQPCRNVI